MSKPNDKCNINQNEKISVISNRKITLISLFVKFKFDSITYSMDFIRKHNRDDLSYKNHFQILEE